MYLQAHSGERVGHANLLKSKVRNDDYSAFKVVFNDQEAGSTVPLTFTEFHLDETVILQFEHVRKVFPSMWVRKVAHAD